MSERRPNPRKRVLWSGKVVYANGDYSFPCTIRDWSENGARIAIRGAPIIPKNFYLLNLTSRTAHDATVSWNDGRQLGLKFTKSFSLDSIVDPEIAFLKKAAV
jgi:hypothetical protein